MSTENENIGKFCTIIKTNRRAKIVSFETEIEKYKVDFENGFIGYYDRFEFHIDGHQDEDDCDDITFTLLEAKEKLGFKSPFNFSKFILGAMVSNATSVFKAREMDNSLGREILHKMKCSRTGSKHVSWIVTDESGTYKVTVENVLSV